MSSMDRFGARSQSGLLKPAVEHRLQRHTVLDDQHANATRAVELVCGAAQCIDTQLAEIDRQLADHLHRVGMEPNV